VQGRVGGAVRFAWQHAGLVRAAAVRRAGAQRTFPVADHALDLRHQPRHRLGVARQLPDRKRDYWGAMGVVGAVGVVVF
jgi:hypothetical protein